MMRDADESRRQKLPLYERIYSVIRQIPPGRVATYGQVAAIVADGGARTVGYALAALPSGGDVPWQRVINRQGRVSERAGGGESASQKELLIGEGVLFDAAGRVELARFGWSGPDWDWLEQHGFFPAPPPWL